MIMKKNVFPHGWSEEKVRKILRHYENQTEEEAVAEDEASFRHRNQTFMEIPKKLVSSVRQLLAKHAA